MRHTFDKRLEMTLEGTKGYGVVTHCSDETSDPQNRRQCGHAFVVNPNPSPYFV
jgi:hypothetical protein